jgi:hypothetical protein
MVRRRFSSYVRKRREETAHRRFVPFLILSTGISAMGFGLGPLRALIVGAANLAVVATSVPVCILIAWTWIAVSGAGLVFCRVRGLWLILEAPFVLYFPASFVMNGTCSLLGRCH